MDVVEPPKPKNYARNLIAERLLKTGCSIYVYLVQVIHVEANQKLKSQGKSAKKMQYHSGEIVQLLLQPLNASRYCIGLL